MKFGTITNWRENSWIISLKVKHLMPNGLLIMLVTNFTYIKRRWFLSPNVTFNIDRIKYNNTANSLKNSK